MDPEMLLALQEVDALTPATPPIAPVYGPEENHYGSLWLSLNSGMAAMSQQQINERLLAIAPGMWNVHDANRTFHAGMANRRDQ